MGKSPSPCCCRRCCSQHRRRQAARCTMTCSGLCTCRAHHSAQTALSVPPDQWTRSLLFPAACFRQTAQAPWRMQCSTSGSALRTAMGSSITAACNVGGMFQSGTMRASTAAERSRQIPMAFSHSRLCARGVTMRVRSSIFTSKLCTRRASTSRNYILQMMRGLRPCPAACALLWAPRIAPA